MRRRNAKGNRRSANQSESIQGKDRVMPQQIDRRGVQRLMERGAQIVDVLPAAEYEDLHLPGAISLPLKRLNAETVARLERDDAVVVYCWDYQ
jgi:rhodanese-related sulfurtransferase